MNTNDINQCGQQEQTAKVAEISGLLRATGGPDFPNYPTRDSQDAQDRLVHLVMDELSAARQQRNMATMAAHTANDQNQKLSNELHRTLAQVKLLQQDIGEMAPVLNQREEEVRALKVSMAVLKSELEAINQDPTKGRIRQLLKRIREMAPERQFEVRTHTGRKFQILGALSSNGVTTITVSPRPASR